MAKTKVKTNWYWLRVISCMLVIEVVRRREEREGEGRVKGS